LWYLSDRSWPAPNLILLNNALRQTGWSGPEMSEKNWRLVLADQLQRFNWTRVADDVRPLLEPGVDPNLLTLENLMRVLGGEG
jgi:hypothetical protein